MAKHGYFAGDTSHQAENNPADSPAPSVVWCGKNKGPAFAGPFRWPLAV